MNGKPNIRNLVESLNIVKEIFLTGIRISNL